MMSLSDDKQADIINTLNTTSRYLEPLYLDSAAIAWWLQSTSAQNNVPRC